MIETEQYMEALQEAADSLFKSHFGIHVEITQLDIGNAEVKTEEISVLLGIVGDLKGQIICSFHENTAKNIVGMMMGGMEIPEIDEMAWSAIQEFGNWIAGTTAVEMSKKGISVDVTPPVLSKGFSIFRSPDRFTSIVLKDMIGELKVYVYLENA